MCTLYVSRETAHRGAASSQAAALRPPTAPARNGARNDALPPLLTRSPAPRSVNIKGSGSDSLVLCTDDATYAIQLVETSNTVLLCSTSASEDAQGTPTLARTIEGQVGCSHELKRTAPRLHRIRELLEEEPFRGPDEELRSLEAWHGVEGGSGDMEVEEEEEEKEAGEGGGGMEEEGERGAGAAARDPPTVRAPSLPDADGRGARDGPGYTLAELEVLVQASRGEIVAGLAGIGALLLAPDEVAALAGETRGRAAHLPTHLTPRYRLLTPEYAAAALDDILVAVQGNMWHPGCVPLPALVAAADGHTAAVVTGVARAHSRPAAEGASAAGGDAGPFLALDYTSVALVRARSQLAAAEATFLARRAAAGVAAGGGGLEFHAEVGDFTRAWQREVDRTWPAAPPDAASGVGVGAEGVWSRLGLSVEALKGAGMVLVDTTPTGTPVLRHFPASRLSQEPRERFKQLFAARARWQQADVTPFLAPLVGVDRKLDDMLVAHARSTLQPDGGRLFSVR